MKSALFCFVAVICSACVHRHDGGSRAPQAPAFAATVNYLDRPFGMACLPSAGDSTRFEVAVILDSLRGRNPAALSVIRAQRSPPRPGYINQIVTVEVQRAGQTRLVGTSCWHDAGIVIRGPGTALEEATVHVIAPGTILVRVFDARGTLLVDGVRLDSVSDRKRINWTPPPNER